jgi:hypothetical protein
MVSEKIEAGLALQALALNGGLGLTPHSAAIRTIAHYGRKVRANRRRDLPTPAAEFPALGHQRDRRFRTAKLRMLASPEARGSSFGQAVVILKFYPRGKRSARGSRLSAVKG